jgi:SAM-dependent methyltransferase
MMALTLEQIHAGARERGLDARLMHFSNLTTQSQFRLPYTKAQKLLAPGANVLDWGCGNGHFSYMLGQIGVRVTGYSLFGPPAIQEHVANFSFAPGKPEEPVRLPFDTGAFDAVVNVGVLQIVHTSGGNDQESLRELFRILKPGGMFLTFHLPNKHACSEWVARTLRLNENLHDFKYDRAQIDRMWRSAGFEVAEAELYNFLPRNQLRKLPASLNNNRAVVAGYNAFDDVLSAVLLPWCQNWYILGRKPA